MSLLTLRNVSFAYAERNIQAVSNVSLALEKGEYVALSQARSSAVYYMRGLHHAPALRRACCSLKTLADVDKLIEQVLEENPT